MNAMWQLELICDGKRCLKQQIFTHVSTEECRAMAANAGWSYQPHTGRTSFCSKCIKKLEKDQKKAGFSFEGDE